MSFKRITLSFTSFTMCSLLADEILLSINVTNRLYITKSKICCKLWASQGNNNFEKIGNFMKRFFKNLNANPWAANSLLNYSHSYFQQHFVFYASSNLIIQGGCTKLGLRGRTNLQMKAVFITHSYNYDGEFLRK